MIQKIEFLKCHFLVSDNIIILSLILFCRVVRLSSLLTFLGGSSE